MDDDRKDLTAEAAEVTEEHGEAQPPQIENQKPQITNAEEELHALLRQAPAVSAMLYHTLKSGRWLITVHRKVKDSPPDDIESDASMKDFPTAEIVGSMQGLCRSILAGEDRRLHDRDAQAVSKQRWR